MTGEGAMTMAGGRRGFTVAHAGLVSALSWIVALTLSLTVSSGLWRTGLLVGVIVAIVSGAAGLVLTARAENGNVNAALLSRVVGFLFRMLLIAGGLVVTIRGLRAEPLGFVLGYFPLFFLSTALEQLVFWSSRAETPSAPSAGGGAR